jgi:SAM-dependent methyltransferase
MKMWEIVGRFEELIVLLPFLAYARVRHVPCSLRCKQCGRRILYWGYALQGKCGICMQKAIDIDAAAFYATQPCSGDTFSRNRSGIEHCYAAISSITRTGQGKILDVGWGDGLLLKRLISDGKVLYGIDMSACEVNKARTRLPAAEIACGDVRNLPYPLETFDYAICTDVMEHIPGNEVSEACFRVLKQGGTALFTVPVGRGRRGKSPQHVRRFSLDSFSAILEEAGFEIISKRCFGLHIPLITYLAEVTAGALNKRLPFSSPLNVTLPELLATHIFVEGRKPVI